jgi:hypothetical protein
MRLAEAANEQRVPLGAIVSDDIKRGFPFGRINRLSNAQERSIFVNPEQLRDICIGGRGVHFFIGVTEFYSEIVF